MFGNNAGSTGFGGFGSNPQQQQAGGTGGGIFGSGGGFGSTPSTGFGQTSSGGGFGTAGATATGTGIFGQPQQQQQPQPQSQPQPQPQPQPQQSTGFGGTGFGAATSSPFGQKPAFGSGTSTTGTGLFGSTPSTTTSTGFGGFGNTGTAGTGAFGSTTPSTTSGGIFGSKPAFGATTTTAGTTGGLFGTAGSGSGTGFGAAGAGFGAAATTNTSECPGTAGAASLPFTEKDPGSSMMNHFHTITFLPQYQKWSPEELRMADYLQGRRFPSGGSFGQGTGFGTGGFAPGATAASGFGPTASSGGGLFGSGTTGTSGGFGTGTTGFGTGTSSAPAPGGLFGGNKAAGPGLFGSGTSTPNTSGGGLFGSQPSTNTGGFGTGTAGAFGTGAFGATQPSTGFGPGTTTTGSLFGSQQTGTTSGFGNATQPTPPGFGGFGPSSQPQTVPTQSPFGGFGAQNQQQQQQQQQPKPFGTFGSTTTPSTGAGLFGQTGTNTQQSGQTGGLFGSKPGFGTNPSAQSATGGLFSGAGTAGNMASGGLFNPQQQAQQQPATGGLFGGAGQATTPGGLFGGNKPVGAGIFSGTPGSTTTGGGLFGGGFGTGVTASSQQQQPGLGGSLFSGSTIQQGQQSQAFTASINDANPYGPTPLMAQPSGSPGPLATPIGSVQKKKAAMLPHNKIAPRAPQLTPRLGGSFSRSGSPFAASSSGGAPLTGSLGRSFSAGSNKPHLFDSDDSLLSSGAFTPSNSNRVASLKRLVIDKNIRDQDLFTGAADLKAIKDSCSNDGKPKGILKKMVSFDTGANVRRDEDVFGEAGSSSPTQGLSTSTQPNAEELGFLRSPKGKEKNGEHNSPPSVTQEGQQASVGETAPTEEAGDVVKHGDYWMSPSVEVLKRMDKDKLKRVTNLTVGRKGYGQVRFEPAVDVSEIIPEDIPGGIVEFDSRVCTVYPEHLPKPPPGKGLNVPAIISLEDCFPQYRENRAPVKNPEHPRYQTHLTRLKGIANTEFVDYIANDGIWIFKVQHFTTYGLVDENDEETSQENDTTITETEEDGDYTVSGTEESFFSGADDSLMEEESSIDDGLNETSNIEDTFEFKKYPPSSLAGSMQSRFSASVQSRPHPGGYDGDDSFYNETDEGDTTLTTQEENSFLGDSSVDSTEEGESEDEPTELDQTEEVDESVVINTEINQMDLLPPSPTKRPMEEDGLDTPKALPLAKDWTEQLNMTISPIKKRKGFMSTFNQSITFSPSKNVVWKSPQPTTYGHLDMVNDLFSENVWKENTSGSPKKREGRGTLFQELPRPVTKSTGCDDTLKHDPRNLVVRPAWTTESKVLFDGELVNAITKRQNYPQASYLRTGRLLFPVEDNQFVYLLSLQYLSTEVKRDKYKIPFAELDHRTSFASFAELPWHNTPTSQHEQSVWRLASILFDPVDLNGPFTIEDHILEQRLRKDKLSRFFEELVERYTDEHVRNAETKEEVALAHLTGHRIEQACATLLDAKCFRLATLISSVGGDRKLREDISEQIVEWRNRGVLAEMSIPIRALYELLAGNTCYAQGLAKPYEDAAIDFYFSKQFQLNWKGYFGLKLWYASTEDRPLSEAVELYEQDMATHGSEDKVVRPKPWYTEAGLGLDLPSEPRENGEDLLWGLLKIYTYDHIPLEEVLNPHMHGPETLDYRLTWQLRTIMSRKKIRDFTHSVDISAGLPAQLTINFASQLEASGQWEWALFVIMHLNDVDSREDAMRKLIGRHVADLDSQAFNPRDQRSKISKEAFLRDYLLVPQEWIYEAKALHARFVQEHIAEAEYLIKAEDWIEAHKAVVQQVAPNAIISGDLSELKNLLAKFGEIGAARIRTWVLGGQAYLDYIALCSWKDFEAGSNSAAPQVPTMKGAAQGIPKQMEEIRSICRRLLNSLPNMERVNFQQKVAVAEMGRTVSSVVIKSNLMTSDAPKILSLPLTEDEYLKKTISLSLGYYKSKLQMMDGVR